MLSVSLRAPVSFLYFSLVSDRPSAPKLFYFASSKFSSLSAVRIDSNILSFHVRLFCVDRLCRFFLFVIVVVIDCRFVSFHFKTVVFSCPLSTLNPSLWSVRENVVTSEIWWHICDKLVLKKTYSSCLLVKSSELRILFKTGPSSHWFLQSSWFRRMNLWITRLASEGACFHCWFMCML